MRLGRHLAALLVGAMALACSSGATSEQSEDAGPDAADAVSEDAAPPDPEDVTDDVDIADIAVGELPPEISDDVQSSAPDSSGDGGTTVTIPAIEPGTATYRPGGLLVTYFPGETASDLSGPLPDGGELALLSAVDLTPETGARATYPKKELLIAIDGGVKVESAGVYRLVLLVSGAARLSLGGVDVVDVADASEVIAFDRKVQLSPGWYPFTLRVQRDVLHPHLQVFFGPEDAVLTPLAGAQLGYATEPPEGTPDLAATVELVAQGSRWARLGGTSSLPASLRLDWTGKASGSLPVPGMTRIHDAVIGLDAGGSYSVTATFTDLWDRVVTTDAVPVVTPTIPTYRPGGLLGEYFQGGSFKTFETRVASRLDGPVDVPNSLDGNTSGSFRIDMAVDKFAIRWEGGVLLPEAGLWTFTFTADDGNRIYLDDVLMDENWNDHGMEPVSATLPLPAGWHPIRVEMYEQGGAGGATLEWEGPNTPRGLIPGDQLGADVSDAPGAPTATLTVTPGEAKGSLLVTVATSELAALSLVLSSPGLTDVVLPASSPTTSYRWSGTVPSGTWTATASLVDLGGDVGTQSVEVTVP